MKNILGALKHASTAGIVVLALVGCSADPSTPGPSSSNEGQEPAYEVVSRGWSIPWGMVDLGTGELLVGERAGTIFKMSADGTRARVKDVPGVTQRGEGGLLGLAMAPGSGYVHAYFTRGDENVVVRMSWDGNALGEPEVGLDGIKAADTHNGGRIEFGPDGMLYIGTGDAQDRPAAQDPGSLNGKVLRISPDGAVPADNPTPGSPVFTLGHRNVQGIGFDADGRTWASEFGQDTFDELNVLVGGRNYGWPVVEGEGGDSRFVDPEVVWDPSEASPSGLAVVDGVVVVAALRGERVWRVPALEGGAGEPVSTLEGELGRVRTVVARGDGDVWVLTSNGNGDDVVALIKE